MKLMDGLRSTAAGRNQFEKGATNIQPPLCVSKYYIIIH
jgi:hypothetical protein